MMAIKKSTTMLFYSFLCLLLIIFLHSTSFANKLSKKTNELKSISHQITVLKTNVSRAKFKKRKLIHSLKKTNQSLGKLSKDIHYTNFVLHKQQTKLSETEKKQKRLQKKLKLQKQLLTKQTRLMYMLGDQPHLKLILNQEQPEQLNRYLQYYVYLQKARHDNMIQIKQTTNKLNQLALKLAERSQQLSTLQNKQQQTFFIKNKQKIKHQHLLHITDNTLRNQQKRLRTLYANKKRLGSLIKKLSKKATYGYIPGSQFSQMRRKLFWPIAHKKILQHFGQSIEHSYLHSNGIVILTNHGAQVRSIFPGKIVYANWLRGFGLLVIEQHGRDYLTLYGYNQSLFVKSGQKVKAGQMIAQAGKGENFDKPTLYFEIRHKNKPINPLSWLKKT